jgi:DNA-binding MarR family transcriptional regulator
MYETSLLLHRVVAALDRAGDRALRSELDISHSRAVLLLLVDREGPISQHDLAERLGCTDPAVTALLREVSRDGLVEVSVDLANRRRNLVSLTSRGRRVVADASVLLGNRFAQLLAVADVDNEELLSLLVRLNRALTTTSEGA